VHGNWLPVALLLAAASAAQSAVVISEIMYDPVGGGTNEFVELHNAGTGTVSVAGWYFADGITYTFPAGTTIGAGDYLVVAINRAAFQMRYPGVTNLAPGFFNGQLNNGGERLSVADPSSNRVFDVTYDNNAPWPEAAAGLGSSLVLVDPAGPANDPANWRASANLHGSPGEPGGFFVRDVVINEVLAHTDPPQEDAVELANLTTNAIGIGGWYLSDDNAVRKKYRFPDGTVIPAGGYLVVYQAQMTNGAVPFSISSKGDDVYLSEADGQSNIVRYVDQVEFEPTKNGVAVGRHPDGTGESLIALSTATLGVDSPGSLEEFRTGTGARNAGPYVGPLVISEIMYRPVASNMAGRMEAEFVEIANRTPTNVPLFNPDYPELPWSLTGGISYRFPSNTVLAAGQRLVVISTNAFEAFRASWGLATNAAILGPFTNQLGNAGDTVRMRAPNNPEPGTNAAAYHVEDEVHYDDDLPWPLAADGLGGSLERTDLDAWGDTAGNWHSTPGTATPCATNSVFVPPGAVVISEIMAVNRHTVRDEDGDFSDYIELYNTTEFPVSLAGWHLTDQQANPALWTFPAVTIPARGTLVVFASQKDRTNDVNFLHTNFALDAAGEYLALFRSDLVLEYAFDPAYPPQTADVAYGHPDIGGRNATAVRAGSAGRCLVPTNAAMLAVDWPSRTFDDSAWLPAGNGVGFDTDTTYLSLIETDLKAAMLNRQASAFVRYPFVITHSADASRMLLRLKYDDGIDVFLNGVRVASNNVPAGATWNSSAPSSRSDSSAIVFEDRDLSSFVHLLVDGTNVLAIQGLNNGASSGDFLALPELQLSWSGATGIVVAAPGYLAAGTPGSANGPVLPGFVGTPVFSHPGGLFSGSLSVTVSCASAGAVIRYTLDGTEPTTNSPVYIEPLAVTNDVEIVARAYAVGLVPSPTAGVAFRSSFLGINEILASNATATPELKDHTDFGDWIEIYNGGAEAVDLGGYHLSDSSQQPFRWQIPTGTVIAAGGFLFVWADGGDLEPGLTLTYPFWPYYTHVTLDYHANFKLGAEGEEVGLFSPAGSRIDSVVFGLQMTDISYGRHPDGAATWGYFGEPTARTNNRPPVLSHNLHRAPAVAISPDGPLFTNGTVTVTLASGPEVTEIRYTTNGAAPSSASILFTNPVMLTTSGVIRARAYAAGLHPGPVATRTFLVNERQPDLPILSMVVDPFLFFDPQRGIYTNVIKEREVPGHLEFHTTPTNAGFRIDAGFRIYGLNTFLYAQKPFTVYLDGKYGQDVLAYQLFPDKAIGEFDRFILRNGNDDWSTTFFRDTLGQSMLRGVLDNAIQSYRPCAMYLNGRYYGLMNIQEKMDEMYCVKNRGVALEDVDFFEMDGTATTDDWILNAGTADGWNALMAFVGTNNLADPAAYAHVKSQVDIEDLVDYVAGQVFVYDSSWFHNRKWWRDRNPGGKWRFCFVDLDRALRTNSLNSNVISTMTSGSRDMFIFRECISNAEFRAYAVQRIMAHLGSSFSTNRTLPLINAEAQRLRNEMVEHIKAYGTRGGIPSLATWDAQVEAVRIYVRQRPAIALQQVASYFGTGQTARIRVDTGGGAGRITANHVALDPSVTNTFVAGLPVRIKAIPEIGQTFVQWEFIATTNVPLVVAGAEWRYLVPTNEVPGWNDPGFDDAAWASGPAQLGYGDGDESTTIGHSSNLTTAAYFRRPLVVTNAAALGPLNLRLLADDGAIVYVNGGEILRQNMPTGTIAHTTLSVTNVPSPAENYFIDYFLSPTNLVEGSNSIAVEVHQTAANYTDLGFDLSIVAYVSGTQTVAGAETEVVPSAALDIRAVFAPTGASVLPGGTIGSDTTLTAAGSPWLATGDIFVPSNTTLTVEPGTTIRMPDGASVRVQGRLLMLGTTGQPVRVEANPDAAARRTLNSDPLLAVGDELSPCWGGITFEHATHAGILSNVVLRGASLAAHDPVNLKAAVSALGSDLFMHGIDLDEVRFPIFVQEGAPTVLENSRIRLAITGDGINIKRAAYARVEGCEFSGAFAVDADAIDYDGVHGGIIRGNHLHDFLGDNDDAIDIGELATDLLVESNFIARCSDKGVSIGQGSTALVRHNVIRNVALGAGIKDAGSFGLFENNTFHNTGNAIAVYEKNPGAGGGGVEVRNCIFSGTAMEPVTIDALSTGLVSWCLSDTLAVAGAGNRLGEPLFERAGADNFRLQTGSPAIDSGSPVSPADADGSRTDMGAVAFDWREGHAVINEIHYHPADTNQAEYLELHNPGSAALDLAGWRFGQGLTFEFPAGTVLPAGGYLLLCAGTNGAPVVPNRFAWTAGVLDNAGETLELLDAASNVMDKVTYLNYAPWPAGPDGLGPSLSLIDPRWDNSRPESWYASGADGGTPGGAFDHQFPGPVGAGPLPGSAPGGVRFDFDGVPGLLYVLEGTDDLLHPDWQPTGVSGLPSGGRVVLDLTPPPGSSNRFYRIRVRSP